MRNVLVILCDQLRPDFLNIYGCPAIPTPNLDRLAAMGVVFDRAITASTVCAPARAGMMTGRHVSDHGVWSNSVPFRPGMDLIAERMNALGYRTGAFGKLHHHPDRHTKGFQIARLMEEGRLGDDDYLKHLRTKYPDFKGLFRERDGAFLLDEEDYYGQGHQARPNSRLTSHPVYER